MEKISTFFGLKLSMLVFASCEQLSLTLQGKDTLVQDAVYAATVTRQHLNNLRSEEKFNTFYESVVSSSTNLTNPPVLPHFCKPPRQPCDGSTPAHPLPRHRTISGSSTTKSWTLWQGSWSSVLNKQRSASCREDWVHLAECSKWWVLLTAWSSATSRPLQERFWFHTTACAAADVAISAPSKEWKACRRATHQTCHQGTHLCRCAEWHRDGEGIVPTGCSFA